MVLVVRVQMNLGPLAHVLWLEIGLKWEQDVCSPSCEILGLEGICLFKVTLYIATSLSLVR